MPAKTLEEILENISDVHRPVVDLLRDLIRRHAPKLVESVKWGNLTYHSAEHAGRNAAAILAHKNHVNLQLWGGAHFADPTGALEGTGKDMRHVKLRSPDDVKGDVLVPLILQAADSVA